VAAFQSSETKKLNRTTGRIAMRSAAVGGCDAGALRSIDSRTPNTVTDQQIRWMRTAYPAGTFQVTTEKMIRQPCADMGWKMDQRNRPCAGDQTGDARVTGEYMDGVLCATTRLAHSGINAYGQACSFKTSVCWFQAKEQAQSSTAYLPNPDISDYTTPWKDLAFRRNLG
jgi:hypothetical protein